MSVQACRIRGFGYKFDYEYPLFSFIKGEDEEEILDNEYDFIDVLGLNFSYYDMHNTPSDKNKRKLMIITDGMNGNYKAVMFVTQVIDMYDTHGFYEQGWVRDFRNDDWLRKCAKRDIETLLQRKFDEEPIELDLEYYS
jgi:hypothetical protein